MCSALWTYNCCQQMLGKGNNYTHKEKCLIPQKIQSEQFSKTTSNYSDKGVWNKKMRIGQFVNFKSVYKMATLWRTNACIFKPIYISSEQLSISEFWD